jgi:hypothetical protein
MRRVRGPLLVGGALLAGLDALVVHEGDERVWWYRGVVVVMTVLALRALVRWLDSVPAPIPASPFRRRRIDWRRVLRRRAAPVGTKHGSERALHLARLSAGDAHRGLRPLLREVADARLRARHGIALDDPGASALLAPATWDFVRGDRPVPHDLRARGLAPEDIDALLTDLEKL